jgi:hypothetical protein
MQGHDDIAHSSIVNGTLRRSAPSVKRVVVVRKQANKFHLIGGDSVGFGSRKRPAKNKVHFHYNFPFQ